MYHLSTSSLRKKKDNLFINIIGKRETGKTSLVICLLKKIGYDEHDIIFCCMTDAEKQLYKNVFPGAKVIDKIDIKLMEQFKCIVIDDALRFNEMKSDPMLALIASKNHTKIICNQQPAEFGSQYKDSIDYIYMFKDPQYFTKEKLYRLYGTKYDKYPTYNDFTKDFDQYTSNYGTMILNNVDKCYNFYTYDFDSVMNGTGYFNKCVVQ